MQGAAAGILIYSECVQHQRAQRNNPETIRILVAHNDSNVRSAVKCASEQYPGLSVTAEASNSNELPEKLLEARPDILLLDWELSGDNLPEILGEAGAEFPRLTVVVLSGRPECRSDAMEAGAAYFIIKGEPPEHLINTLMQAAGACHANQD